MRRAAMLRPWLAAVPEWWLVSVCLAVELFARLDVPWEVAQGIAYELVGEMVAGGKS